MVAETGHHNEQYLRSLVLDDSALAAMTKEREELAARADIASNLDNLMHGPLASNLMSAFETVRNAIADLTEAQVAAGPIRSVVRAHASMQAARSY